MRRLPILLAAIAALLAPACGAPTGTPGDASLSPEDVASGYVEALDERDGERFCGLLAPYIAGRYDIYFRDPDHRADPRVRDCASFVSSFIGYVEDCGTPREFKRVKLIAIDRVEGRGELRLVHARIRLEQKTTCRIRDRLLTTTRDERVWVARVDGAWRIAKLGRLAQEASLQIARFPEEGEVRGDGRPDERPDLEAEQRAYAAVAARFDRRMRAREASFRPAGDVRDCSGGVSVDDPRGDQSWNAAGRANPPAVPAGDLVHLDLAVAGRTVCVRWRLAGDLDRPLRLHFGHGGATSDFDPFFDVELRADRTARVTSYKDYDDHLVIVPATVGASGSSVSLLLDAESFKAARRPYTDVVDPSDDSFRFSTSVTLGPDDFESLIDQLGPGRELSYGYHYPEGRPCTTPC